MHIDLIETLRCPRGHEESWLVATFDRMVGRQVAEGRLGCPVCRAEYPIERGAVHFERRGVGDSAAVDARPASGMHASAGRAEPDAEGAIRLAAMLSLAEGSGVAVLAGSWGTHAASIAALAPDVHLLLLNPEPAPRAVEERGEGISAMFASEAIPVAAGSARGVALDAANGGAGPLADAVRALGAGGRLVAPTDAPLPEGVAELARDGSVWVAERRETPRLVPLARGGRR